MRRAFLEALIELTEQDERIFVLTADTGFKVFDDFQKRFPDRYLNIGVSESGMVGLAAGLALEGRLPFLYGIVPFVTMRCFEHIRADLCFHNLPVRIVGVGAGLTYGAEGGTHHSPEDIALMSALPNMTVVCPGDPIEARAAVHGALDLPGPMYLRLGKSGEPVVHSGPRDDFAIGRLLTLRQGKDVALLTTGNMLETTVKAADQLVEQGLSPTVVSVHTVKPIDRAGIIEVASRCATLVTVEEHIGSAGLGSAVANILAEEALGARLIKVALPDLYVNFAGTHDHLRAHFGLTSERVVATVLEHVNA